MAPAILRSCYVLELSVQPGGSRWAELHAYTDPRHIRAWIDEFTANSAGLSTFHAIWYGATLGVWIVQRGVVTEFIDLHPHLSARLDGSEWVSLSEAHDLVIAARPPEEEEDEDEDEEEDPDRAPPDFEDCDLDAYDRVELKIDWEAVAARLPALAEPLLGPGQRTRVTRPQPAEDASYLDDDDEVVFGSRDVECGEPLSPPFSIPGWTNDDDGEDEDEEEDDDDADADDDASERD